MAVLSDQLSEKITSVEKNIASDIQIGKTPDPSTQSVVENSSLFPNPNPPPPPLPPTKPPGEVGPPPPPSPIVSTPPLKRKSRLVGFLFLLLILTVIVGVVFATGLVSKIAPQLGLGTITISYWGLWEQESVFRPIFDEYEKSHPGIKVDYKIQAPLEYRERLQSALSQSKGPDIFRIHNTWIPMLRSDLDAVPGNVYTPQEFEKTFYPAAQSASKVGGNYVSIPLEYDGIAMFINDDLLAKSGLAVPADWDQLREAALVMSECVSQTGACTAGSKILVSGVAMGSIQNVDHWEDIIAVLMMQNNVNLNNPAVPTTKPAEDVLEYFSGFAKTYHIWDAAQPSSTTSFAAGKVGIYFGPSWRVFDILAQNADLKFSIYPVPQLAVDPDKGEVPITYASYWTEAVNKKSPHVKPAWELLKFLSSQDTLKKFYQQAISSNRAFGEPYSRVDLADSLKDQKYVGAFIKDAPLAKSWYLASSTRDGKTGINSRLSELFAKALEGRAKSVSALATEINKVLSDYGLPANAVP